MKRRGRPVLVLALVSLLPVLASAQVDRSRFQTLESTNAPAEFPGIVVLNADIVGQVFFAAERRSVEEPASDLPVRITIPENGEVLFKTRTNPDGGYAIPRIKEGVYRLEIGALHLNLMVLPQPPRAEDLPKVIITILPREMARYVQDE